MVDAVISSAHSTFCAPVQLWIGSPQTLAAQTIAYLQKIFCIQKACGICVICAAIARRNFYNCVWLEPEKQYTREVIQPIFDRIQFALDPHEQFFFIITKADTLSLTAANALLKSFEEPAAGYYFILHSTNEQAIIPTIKSRSVLFNFAQTASKIHHASLYAHFTNQPRDAYTFMQELETSKITEQDTTILIEQILDYWVQNYKKALETNQSQKEEQSLHKIELLQKNLYLAPMPGSAKLFWKNLFLQTI